MIDGEATLKDTAPEDEELSGQMPPLGRIYQIHVKGHLNSTWADWLEGLEVELLDSGEMILSGPVVDQAALIGLLNKLARLNLTLLSVNEVISRKRGTE